MMPEMDGFDMLEELRAQPQTSQTPVIVVSAKELTKGEKEQLEGQITKLMMKGDFLNDDLLDEIGKVLE
jgi:CheY-like chemotaxis protein